MLPRIEGRLRELDVWRLRCLKTDPEQRHFQHGSRYIPGPSRRSAIDKFDHREWFHNISAADAHPDFHRLDFSLHLPSSRIM